MDLSDSCCDTLISDGSDGIILGGSDDISLSDENNNLNFDLNDNPDFNLDYDSNSYPNLNLSSNSNSKSSSNTYGNDFTLSRFKSVLTSSYSLNGGSFEDIQSAINHAADGDDIILNGTFTTTGSVIVINKTLTIIGSPNAVLDAKNISKIFLVEADGVNLKNLTFINGKSRNESDNGPYQGTVNWQGSNGTIVNCSFINNSGDEKSYGASILWKGSYGKISDSIFKNSYSGANGGAIFALGENLTINNSEFINNHGKEGGAIYFGGSSAMWIINSIFINNSADSGGALAACAMNRQVINSKFIGNSANNGGSISWCGSNGLISNSTFINNSADQKGGSILFTGTNNLVKGSVFINSSANIGGAINSLNRLNYINDLRFENNNASLGEDCYGDLEFKRFSTSIACEDMVTSAIDANLDGRNGEYFNVSLKDEYGNPLINKDIKIGFNGRIYNRTTNSNGQAS